MNTAGATAELGAAYQARGWRVLLYASGEKKPRYTGWPERVFTAEEIAAADGQNIGIVTGAVSGGLADVDLDCAEALTLASAFLPATEAAFGRASRPDSHRLYLPEPVPSYVKFEDTSGETLLELRTNAHQTMVPPSLHPSGERVAWSRFGEPGGVAGDALLTSCRELAAAVLLARHWPKVAGSRQDVALALAGGLLRAGWDEDRTGWFIGKVAAAAGDDEASKRATAAGYTAKRVAAGERTTGWRSLGETVGADVVRRVREWLGATGESVEGKTALSAHTALSAQWPEKLSLDAMHGITGAFVKEVEPHTEADQAALLVQFLVAAGCAIGAGPHMMVGADRHTARLFAVLVGTTSRGRKGSSEGWVRRIVADATPGWAEHVVGGLSTGEGLIWTVRDPIYEYQTPKARKGEPAGEPQLVMTDPGVDDKRLLVVESEYARLLKVAERDGNTVSPIIRQAWDSGDLRVMTRSSPAVATGAHISIIGHVTAEELRRRLTETEVANGLANRFMWVCTRRSKLLPDGGTLRPEDLLYLARDLGERLASARTIGEVHRSQAAGELWREVYPDLTREAGGLYGAVTARAEAQVLRLSLLYALLDASRTIEPQHLHAALAVWRYCDQSAHHIFGDALGDPVADEILRALAGAPQGLTRTELRDLFSRHVGAGRLTTALEYLASVGRAVCSTEPTGGRPSERWRISAPHGAESAESAESPTRDREPGDDDEEIT